jgi:hypothetical protein
LRNAVVLSVVELEDEVDDDVLVVADALAVEVALAAELETDETDIVFTPTLKSARPWRRKKSRGSERLRASRRFRSILFYGRAGGFGQYLGLLFLAASARIGERSI